MLLDTASLYFRAFFGVPDSIKAPDGTPVNAVRGLLDFIARLVDDYRPTHLVVLLGQRLAPAVARRPDPVVQGAPGRVRRRRASRTSRRSRTRSRRRSRSSSTSSRRFGIAIVGRRRLRGRRRDRHAGDRRRDAGRRRHRRPRPVPARRRRRRGAGALHRPRRRPARAGRPTPWCARSTASTPASTPTSPPCAATPPTACPVSPGIGEKTAADAAEPLRRPDAHHRGRPGPGGDMGTGPRGKIKDAADYLEVAPTVVAVARDIDLGTPDLTLPSTPADPDMLVALAEQWGLDSPVARLVDTLTNLSAVCRPPPRRQSGSEVHHWGTPPADRGSFCDSAASRDAAARPRPRRASRPRAAPPLLARLGQGVDRVVVLVGRGSAPRGRRARSTCGSSSSSTRCRARGRTRRAGAPSACRRTARRRRSAASRTRAGSP